MDGIKLRRHGKVIVRNFIELADWLEAESSAGLSK
jgi:hypothetical protein